MGTRERQPGVCIRAVIDGHGIDRQSRVDGADADWTARRIAPEAALSRVADARQARMSAGFAWCPAHLRKRNSAYRIFRSVPSRR